MQRLQVARVTAAAVAGTLLLGGKAAFPDPVEQRARSARPERTLVIYGASYARGWGTPALPGYDRVINRGVGGEETGDMLERFGRDVVAVKPDAVLIWGHVNNITRSSPEKIPATKAAAREHYTAMLQAARAADIRVMFATEIPWTEPTGILNGLHAFIGRLRGKRSYAERVSAHVGELNQFLRELCRREKLVLLDFEHVFATEAGTRRPEYTVADGSHISEAGYAALTAYAKRELSSSKAREAR